MRRVGIRGTGQVCHNCTSLVSSIRRRTSSSPVLRPTRRNRTGSLASTPGWSMSFGVVEGEVGPDLGLHSKPHRYSTRVHQHKPSRVYGERTECHYRSRERRQSLPPRVNKSHHSLLFGLALTSVSSFSHSQRNLWITSGLSRSTWMMTGSRMRLPSRLITY